MIFGADGVKSRVSSGIDTEATGAASTGSTSRVRYSGLRVVYAVTGVDPAMTLRPVGSRGELR